MNFLFDRWMMGVVLLASAGCAGAGAPSDVGLRDAPPTALDAAGDANADAGVSDAAPSHLCPSTGTGQVRVRLEVDPRVDLSGQQVWLAAMCLDRHGFERSVRVAWADLGRSTTLSGLGAGRYIVRASALVVPGVRSSEILVAEGSMNVTQLALAAGPRPLRILRATVGGRADAGVGVDAAADGGLPPGTRVYEEPILRPGTVERVGVLVAYVSPRDRESFDVEVQVRNEPCSRSCMNIRAESVELRVAAGGQPLGLAVAPFGPTSQAVTIPPGSTVETAPTPLTLPGALEDPTLELTVALHGALEAGP